MIQDVKVHFDLAPAVVEDHPEAADASQKSSPDLLDVVKDQPKYVPTEPKDQMAIPRYPQQFLLIQSFAHQRIQVPALSKQVNTILIVRM
jgi:hypothetical protein